ncbi:hypothetical protein CSB20_04830 [bacterium DOLZORAL124_64_63]|nr:MAG: hypothetical protein CSB20_04830 [bacterium DOLZORAL124_64_63]
MGKPANSLFINLISAAPENTGKALRAGRKFLGAGWQVTLSINVEAVRILDPGIGNQLCPVAGKPVADLLRAFQAEGGQVLVGAECLKLAGLGPEHLFTDMRIAKFPLIEEALSVPGVVTLTW